MSTTTTVLPLGTYQAGVRSLGPVAVPLDITGFILVLDRTLLTSPSLRVSIQAERSFDAGASWEGAGGCTFDGGVFLDGDGNPETEVGFSVELPQSTNPNRRLRATVTLNEAVTSAARLTTLP